MEGFANAERNELLDKILELTKDGYDFGEEDGVVELRFVFLDEASGETSPEGGEERIGSLYRRFIELGMFDYNWDTVPFSMEAGEVEGVDCVRCWLNLSPNHLDEWYVLYLCFKMTESQEGLAVQVVSGDGDPVLIGLAEVLPGWLKPSNSANRCFLVDGRVYLIPPELLRSGTQDVSLKTAIDIIRFRLSSCYTEESFTSVFMDKFESISRINQQEKSHHFFVILPRGVAGMVLEFHYLLAISLRHLLNNSSESPEVRALMRAADPEKDLSWFLPNDLVRVKICMTRTQYSRFMNEALLTVLPRGFSKSCWIHNLPKDLQDQKFHSELSYGCLLTFGIYLTYLINPSNSLNLFIWRYLGMEHFKERQDPDLGALAQDSLELFQELQSKDHQDFRTLWTYLSRNKRHPDVVSVVGDDICDSSDWMNNEEYTKMVIKEIEKIYSENSNSFPKRDLSFADMMEQRSYFDGIELSPAEPHKQGYEYDTDLSDLSLDDDLSDHELEELHEMMRKMDEELKRTLKTSVPTLNGSDEAKRFAQDTFSDSLELEESFGIVGPATVFREMQK
ncbi:hypothetical protein OIY81_2421 [Cryptosporidium canis]|uniref:Uncharacterized protein n=1 Tax=Cryptosporidium canis TaxID=195482 RepID=A0ABQ8P3V7_9CRYT|nr:hypothetical protein OJ252_3295 [Cryptosporidium canis]KAJ1609240.1 hypothetical protein OIY81_2421 [Cryptosporidium canis]